MLGFKSLAGIGSAAIAASSGATAAVTVGTPWCIASDTAPYCRDKPPSGTVFVLPANIAAAYVLTANEYKTVKIGAVSDVSANPSARLSDRIRARLTAGAFERIESRRTGSGSDRTWRYSFNNRQDYVIFVECHERVYLEAQVDFSVATSTSMRELRCP